jgi:signal transduction histidine kinase/ligand-binding sensor domain-containing protein
LLGGLALLVPFAETLLALDPHRALTQYSRTIWTQAQGLPQDSVRAIVQTPDGYLWVGTNEGLARFDGYDFLTFTREGGALPSNTVGKLLVASDGVLWIGTTAGLARYADGRFEKFSAKEGLATGSVTAMIEDYRGVLWVACAGNLYHREHGRFTMIPRQALALEGLQTIYEDRRHTLWAGGAGGLVKQSGDAFVKVLDAKQLGGNFITSMLETRDGLWAAGTKGIMVLRADGTRRFYSAADGLPNDFVLTMLQDRAGNLWVGTYGGLSRLENGRFVSGARDDKSDRDWVWSMFEDREGDLWIGMNGGLNRLRDDPFRNYGRAEGLPGDDPYVIHQDKHGVIWIGYHDSGMLALNGSRKRPYTIADGLPSNEIFAIRDTSSGDLLVSTRNGLSRMHNGAFVDNFTLDANGRTAVYDALEDKHGVLWAATARGVYRRRGGVWKAVVPESAGDAAYGLTLVEDLDGGIWAGTLSAGLWHIPATDDDASKARLYTYADGLGDNQIRALYQDPNGTLWIGTFGGGLTARRNGVFSNFRLSDGLPSGNIAHIQDDGKGNLWLSTSRGISRISKAELTDFAEHKASALHPDNYGVDDGLRSEQCAPASPASGGGARTADGKLWFPTMHNLAMIDPADLTRPLRRDTTPALHLLEASADGRPIDLAGAARIEPGTRRMQIRYAAIFLSAPEHIRYSYRLEGLEKDWTPASGRRVASYSPLPHGSYRFLVRASVPGGGMSESSWAFEVLPHYYERAWFTWLWIVLVGGAAYASYRVHLKRVHDRLGLVFEERARMAREIHDTLAQGFVGILARLDVLSMKMGGDITESHLYLNLARKMAQHSLTEARRSVMNLRAGELESSDLSSVLTSSAHRWVAGSAIDIDVEISELRHRLPEDVEQNVLRIAQEAVTNVVKHAAASTIRIRLMREARTVRLRIEDDGRGFEPPVTFSVIGGHFGILGMRERAQKLRAEFLLASSPGAGTQVEVIIPLTRNDERNA